MPLDLNGGRKVYATARTRKQRAAARKQLLGSMVNSLPVEVVKKVLGHVNEDQTTDTASCSQVCRLWADAAKQVLYRHVDLLNAPAIYKFYTTLMKYEELARQLFTLNLVLPERPQGQDYDISLDVMVSSCLELTGNLEELWFDLHATRHLLTDSVARQLRYLPKLKGLYIQQDYGQSGSPEHSSFDPDTLVMLPRTIQKLGVIDPLDDMLAALPQICDQLGSRRQRQVPWDPVQSPGQLPGSSSGAVARIDDQAGLTSLLLHLKHDGNIEPVFFEALASSLSATLVVLSVMIHPVINEKATVPALINLIKATPRLKELHLGMTNMTPDLFAGMPSLRWLEKLKVQVEEEIWVPGHGWERFSDALISYMSGCPYLHHFTLNSDLTGLAIDPFLYRLIEATSTIETASRLRSLSLGKFTQPTLDKVRSIGPTKFGHHKLVPPSIDAFEFLCTSARWLEHLEIAIPLDDLPRIVDAVESLEHLRSALLHKYKIKRYLGGDKIDFGLFIKSCEDLKRRLKY